MVIDSEPKNYEAMDIVQLQTDSIAEPILQRLALEFLRTKDREYFIENFTGELDSEGYLIRKSGDALTRPSQEIGGGAIMLEIVEKTKAELKKRGYL
ncbi:MAG: hypothetical protein WCW47_01485 [Candidatus Paceibacterota bacterium]|jgi:hypothetical protein